MNRSASYSVAYEGRITLFDKAILAVVLALLVMLFMPGFGRAEGSSLTVYGTSVVSVAPDYAMIVAGYSADNKDVSVAQRENAEKMSAILDAIKAMGIEDKDITTSNFTVESIYSYKEDMPRVTGYRVNNNVNIIVRDIENVAPVLNALFEAGANQSYGLTFRSTKEGEAYRQALTEAIKIAMLKAQTMADASGQKLGAVTKLNEVQNNYYPSSAMYSNSRLEAAADSAKGIGETIRSGLLDISAQVEIVYAFD